MHHYIEWEINLLANINGSHKSRMFMKKLSGQMDFAETHETDVSICAQIIARVARSNNVTLNRFRSANGIHSNLAVRV